MVDGERVARLLDRVLADLHKLDGYRRAGRDSVDERWLDAVKYSFVVAIEGCGRVAHHIVVSEGWRVAESNADAIRALAAHDVVAAATAEPVARAMGLRNLLVRQYAEIDDDRVVANLDRLGEIEQFVRDGSPPWGRPGRLRVAPSGQPGEDRRQALRVGEHRGM